MDGPITVVEGHDTTLFRTCADAEAYFEPPEVRAGVLRAFDADGRRLIPRLRDGDVVFEPSGEDGSAELRSALAASVVAGGGAAPDTCDLGEMLAVAVEVLGYS